MNGIPWILIAIFVTLVLLGIVVVVAVRRGKRPRRVDYRNYFVMGVVWLATGVVLSLLPWFLHGEVSFSIGLFFFAMGLAYTTIGLANRDKWGEQTELPRATTRKLMIIAVLVGALLVLGLELFALYG
jgi:membrane protein CcdC involved in cytochrome C biogenesis